MNIGFTAFKKGALYIATYPGSKACSLGWYLGEMPEGHYFDGTEFCRDRGEIWGYVPHAVASGLTFFQVPKEISDTGREEPVWRWFKAILA